MRAVVGSSNLDGAELKSLIEHGPGDVPILRAADY
jgi:hypothetical protein